MFLLHTVRSHVLNTIPKVLARFPNCLANYFSTESEAPLQRTSVQLTDNVEENVVYEVYDEHWEVDPPVQQIHITTEQEPEEQLPFIRLKNLYNIPELVEVLRREKIQDIVCLNMDNSFIAPFMVIGSGMSKRHIKSTTTRVHKLLKHKLKETNIPLPLFRGIDGSCEWIAVDMSTIILHLFLPSTRLKYDLESLWCAGPRYDEQLLMKNTLKSPDKFNWEQLLSEMQHEKQS
ncbi:unnamed protein product [Heterobilharzia americana]|nr:unnamed protein product [Heterobilharzia americana]CAH8588152.1 unnamed protein product [Heterobilharzia americana]